MGMNIGKRADRRWQTKLLGFRYTSLAGRCETRVRSLNISPAGNYLTVELTIRCLTVPWTLGRQRFVGKHLCDVRFPLNSLLNNQLAIIGLLDLLTITLPLYISRTKCSIYGIFFNKIP